MDYLVVAIECVFPVFIMLCIGAFIRIQYNVPNEVFESLSTMCFRVLLPCMLFDNIYSADLSQSFNPSLIVFLFLGEIIWFSVGYVFSFKVEVNPQTRGTYIQSFFRSNIGIIGVAMAKTMMDNTGVATVTLVIAVLAPLFNILAVIALESCRGGSVPLGVLVRSIIRNNIVRACFLGAVLRALHIRLPEVICNTLSNVGDAGSVLTMVALGASLRTVGLEKNRKKILLASLIRLVITPVVAISTAALLGFRGNALGAVLFTTATPVASTVYSMSVAYNSDHELAGQIVAVTSFFCCITLFLWIVFLQVTGMI